MWGRDYGLSSISCRIGGNFPTPLQHWWSKHYAPPYPLTNLTKIKTAGAVATGTNLPSTYLMPLLLSSLIRLPSWCTAGPVVGTCFSNPHINEQISSHEICASQVSKSGFNIQNP